MELVIAHNPDPDSRLPYLIRLPLEEPLVYATKDVWPRTSGLYCHPLPLAAWPDQADVVERVRLKACARRGAAIDVVADRTRESRTQIVYTQARGRQMIFWQSPRTRKQSRPDVRIPTARASGVRELSVLVDAHEKYPYKFPQAAVSTKRQALPCGDYAVTSNGRTVAAVERKGLEDLVSSLTSGRLRYALGELSALPRAAVVVEAPYSKIFAQEWVRPAQVADGLAELQVTWPTVPIVFCDTRKLAEEWTYRWLSAALVRAEQEAALTGPPESEGPDSDPADAAAPTEPSTRELRAWARTQGISVPDRGRLRPEVKHAWAQAHGPHAGQKESSPP